MRDDTSVAALDVGGTAIKSGLVLPDDRVVGVDRSAVDSSANSDALIDALAQPLIRLIEGAPGDVRAHIAFPAPFDYRRGRPCLRHKFASLHGVDLAKLLRSRLNEPSLPVAFVNDAEAAAVGEARAGAGRGVGRVMMVTLGTGFGSALVVDGRPIRELDGVVIGDLYAGTISTPDGDRTVDDEFCAGGLARRLATTPDRLAAEEGRSAHARAITDFGETLAQFLAPYAERLSAQKIVIGGGAIPRSAHFADAMTRRLRVAWASAELGARGALLGAARLEDSS